MLGPTSNLMTLARNTLIYKISIASSRGSVTYGVAKELARILKPLTGNTIHHVINPSEFEDDIKKNKLERGKCIISYDFLSYLHQFELNLPYKL